MSLEDLVPSLKLCQQIPKGAFEDSALVWWGACVYPRIYPDGVRYGHTWHKRGITPAPTLAEIIGTLPKNVEYQFFNGKFLPCHPKFDEDDFADEKPENAALKLWFELNKEGEQ